MKRWIHASDHNEAFNYKDYIIEYEGDGWCVYEQFTYNKVSGPFRTWVEAEDYIDENL